MSSANKNLSEHKSDSLPDISERRFGIVTSEWNEEVTGALYKGAYDTLVKHGAQEKHITSKWVPGSFELSLGAQWMAEDPDVDAVIAIGCLIQGETPHFDYICQAVALGLKDVNLKYSKPVVFGVLTTLDMQQALDRAGGKYGNKGDEAAYTAIRMLGLR